MDLRHSSDDELLSKVRCLVGSHRELTAKLVAYLAEIEERRLHLLAGYSSMFDFCTKALGLSEGEAFRRIVAARVARRFPVVWSRIATGAVHLSTLVLLRDVLTEENHGELFEAVSGKTNREAEALLAARFPRPDVPSRITRTRVEALSEGRYRVEFTASAELCAKLEHCRDLMSHANPTRDLAVVIERAVDLLQKDLERERLARAKRPRRATALAKPGRISRVVRREVFDRDGLRCSYVSPEGHRCQASAFLELDHVDPRALGGNDEAKNLRVRCRAHNRLWAEQVFGREHVEERIHFRQRKRSAAPEKRREAQSDNERPFVFEKVSQALKSLGFGAAEARRAVEVVEREHAGRGLPRPEEALREAILVSTAAAAGARGAWVVQSQRPPR